MPTLTPHQFVDKWCNVQLNERAAYQQHFLNQRVLIGYHTPAEMDRQGFIRSAASAIPDHKPGD